MTQISDLVEDLQQVVVSHLSDNLQRLQGVTGLQRIHRARKLVGTALTVKVRPGDNLLIYKALTLAQPGQVLVVDGSKVTSNAPLIEQLATYARDAGRTVASPAEARQMLGLQSH